MKKSSHLVFIISLKKGHKMSISDFEQRVKAVYECRNNWIGRIEPRLHDLTGFKLAFDNTYSYPRSKDNVDTKAINTGKKTVVSFPTNRIAEGLGTIDMYHVWQFILSQIWTDQVLLEAEEQIETDFIGMEADKQLKRILNEIRRHEEIGIVDVLGIFSPRGHTIKIYAQVIAYYSIKQGVSAENLAFVVLTHELAHAYTIAGYNINGSRAIDGYLTQRWERDITEGLAQYYTDAICRQFEPVNPGFRIAFEKLRAKQTHPYTWYQDWFNGEQDHERLRTLMIRYRDNQDAGEFRNFV